MKVCLEAFGGTLRSSIMDYPEETGLVIEVSLDMDRPHFDGLLGGAMGLDTPVEKTGRFVWIGGYAAIKDEKDAARIYTLVAIY